MRACKDGSNNVMAPLWGLLLALCVMGLGGCTDGTNTTTCRVDADCGVRGQVCEGGACTTLNCNSLDECGANRGCLVEQGSLSGVCSAKECFSDGDCASFGTGYVCRSLLCVELSACSSNADCAPAGKICNAFRGECVDPPATCTSDADCVSPGTCDTATSSCSSNTCNTDSQCAEGQYCDVALGACTEGCRVGSCPDGGTCDTATRTCNGGTGSCTISECAVTNQACDASTGQCADRTGKGLCEPCADDSECGGPGDRCARFGGTVQCTYACETVADCPSGYSCSNITNTAKACVPENFRCEGCLLEGCESGQVCNPSTSSCQPQAQTCRACTDDFECGSSSRCESYQGNNRCLPSCAGGAACPADYACNNTNDLCEPLSGTCTSCNLDPTTCGTRQLNEELCVCVDCLNDTDCNPGELCAQGTGECVTSTQSCTTDGDCSAGVCYGEAAGALGVCVECETSTDCGGNVCTNNVCGTGAACNPPCGSGTVCSNGVCVPDGGGGTCATDADCGGGTCDLASGLCFTPGVCDPAAQEAGTEAPCPVLCGPDLLDSSKNVCTCLFDDSTCRTGESCLLSSCSAGGGGFPFP